MAARRAAATSISKPTLKFLNSSKPPDFTRILPPAAVFASARKSGFISCNKAQATVVLSEIWQAFQSMHNAGQQARVSAFSKICQTHNFPPSNLTSLATLVTQSPNTTIVSTDLLAIAESLNDPAAILKSARKSLSTVRTAITLPASPAFHRLTTLATTEKIPEAYELIAETYDRLKSYAQGQDNWLKAAQLGSAKGCLMVGKYAAGKGKRDVALEWLKKAAEGQEAEAFYELGCLQLEEDEKEAEYNLSVAAGEGIVAAAEKLERLYKARKTERMREHWEEAAVEMKKVKETV
ncbi:hypothetical protein TWF694_000598 [Orbilia ellipsospora]|uniref:Uncharacterized protein n=1 Tax=Orbilia ellipsospora TaxID=2528407 RepID=A0AAV9XQU2_9PEZI